ncbi:unnamed protein product, partial [Porites evermanni]
SGEAEKVNNSSSLQDAEGDEEYVSLAMLKQMLSVQESVLQALFHSVVSSVTTRVEDLLKTVTEFKKKSRSRVLGIPESVDETWEIVEQEVKKAIMEKLDMEVDIERGHRVEREKKPESAKKLGQPRTIVCRLENWKQKEAVVRKVMKEKPV